MELKFYSYRNIGITLNIDEYIDLIDMYSDLLKNYNKAIHEINNNQQLLDELLQLKELEQSKQKEERIG